MTTLRKLLHLLPFGASLFFAKPAEAQATSLMGQFGPYIARNEGYSLTPYQDTGGRHTVGVGHLLRPGEEVRNYSPSEVSELFEQDLNVAVRDAVKLVPNFWQLDPEAQQVLVDLSFQLGRTKLSKFRGFLHKLQYFQYRGAAGELEHSNYFLQVRSRALRNISLLLNAQERIDYSR